MTLKRLLLSAAIGMSMLTGFSTLAMSHGDDMDDPADNTVQMRQQVEKLTVQWHASAAKAKSTAWRHIKRSASTASTAELSTTANWWACVPSAARR